MCNHYCCDQVDKSVTKILPASALAYHCKNALLKNSKCQTIYCIDCTDASAAQYNACIPQKARAGVGGRASRRRSCLSFTNHGVSHAPTGGSRSKTKLCSYCISNPPGAPVIVPYNPDEVANSLAGCDVSESLDGPLVLDENKTYLKSAYCETAKRFGGEIPKKCLGCKKWLNEDLANFSWL